MFIPSLANHLSCYNLPLIWHQCTREKILFHEHHRYLSVSYYPFKPIWLRLDRFFLCRPSFLTDIRDDVDSLNNFWRIYGKSVLLR
nr:MAG TPA: hypothetical protein [Caudoviricetes sp.]